VVEDLKLEYGVAIRSNHGVWLPKGQKVRVNKWRGFDHQRWDGKTEKRYIRESILGKRRARQDWEITTDSDTVPDMNGGIRSKPPKNFLNNLRLILQPFVSFNLIGRWLKVFPIPQLSLGFPRLIALMNEFDCLHCLVALWDDLCYSSA
jgi:hypothetical protein